MVAKYVRLGWIQNKKVVVIILPDLHKTAAFRHSGDVLVKKKKSSRYSLKVGKPMRSTVLHIYHSYNFLKRFSKLIITVA